MDGVVGSLGHCTDLSASIAVRQAGVSDSWQSPEESLRVGILGRIWAWHQIEGRSGSPQRLACNNQPMRCGRSSFAVGYVSPAPAFVTSDGERLVERRALGPEAAATAITAAVRAIATGFRARAAGSGRAERPRAAAAACRSQRGLLGTTNCEWLRVLLLMLS